MATKSVLKSINIKNKKAALSLVSALENAQNKGAQVITHKKVTSEASRDEIRQMFGARE